MKKNLALSLVTAIAFAALLEGLARLSESDAPDTPVAAYLWDWKERWDGDFYTLVSRSVGWPPDEEFNGDGVRDRTHSVEKLPRVRRVVFLGDSVTLGAGIPPERAYPQRLQVRLDADGHRLEVFNVALWGWSTRQETIAYQRIARRYSPDIVILGVCLNDLPELQNNLSQPPAWLASLHAHSALVRRALNARGREIASVEELFEDYGSDRVEQAFQRFITELEVLEAEVREDGGRFSALIFPFRFQLEPDAPSPTAQQRLLELCTERGLSCIDLLPALRAVGTSAFVDYDHLSPTGSDVVVEEVLRSDWLEGQLTQEEMIGHALAGDDLTPTTLLALTEQERPELREAAVWSLRRSDFLSDAVIERLTALLAHSPDPDPGVRAQAATGLGARSDPPRAAELALYAGLHDTSEAVRHAAALALHELGPSAGDLERLVAALESEDPYIAGFAAWSLGELGPDAADAAPALLEALRDEPLGQGASAEALAKLGQRATRVVPDLVAALGANEPRHRWNAALALGRLGQRAMSARTALIGILLDDPDPSVRGHAATALGRIGGVEVVEPLARALSDPHRQVRALAARALGWLGATAAPALPQLRRALTDPHPKVQRRAARSLEQIQPQR